jgi:hypothetical protein
MRPRARMAMILCMHEKEREGGAQDAAGMVARVMYASRADIQGAVYAEMEKIRASAVRHNEPAGVATALLYQSGWFVQWKEGPGAALLRIMDRVAGDPRHHDLRIVHSSRGPRLLHGPWSMAVVQAHETAAEMEQRVLALRAEVERGLQFAPAAIWRRLSTPVRHPGALRQQEPDAFQRVLVCAAAGTASFDLVRWLGARHGAEVVHRRFAGAHLLDVGTDYADFVEGGRLLRVIAMARNGLNLPLTRAFLSDYSHAVLLLSGNEARDEDLVHRVALACGKLAQPPAVAAIAQQAGAHAEPMALARRYGLAYVPLVAEPEHPLGCWQVLAPLFAAWKAGAHAAVAQGDALLQ